MQLTYYGTAAAEGVPAMFCSCAVCQKSLAAGGRNIRTRSQAMIDKKLLIDFGPDTYLHVLHGGLPLKEAEVLLITHNHSDHVYPADIEMRRIAFAHADTMPPLHIYATASAYDAFAYFVDNSVYPMKIVYIYTKSSRLFPFLPLGIKSFP